MASAADLLRPLFESLLGTPVPITIHLWDGSHLGDEDAPASATFRSPDALRRVVYAPGELGLPVRSWSATSSSMATFIWR